MRQIFFLLTVVFLTTVTSQAFAESFLDRFTESFKKDLGDAVDAVRGLAGREVQPNASGSPAGAKIEPETPPREQVREIQQLLHRLGYEPGIADGFMGPSTQGAISAYQRDTGLEANGLPSIALLEQLRTGLGSRLATKQVGADRTSQSTTRLPKGELMKLQYLLNKAGYEVGPVDGVWRARAEEAIAAYRRDYATEGLPLASDRDVMEQLAQARAEPKARTLEKGKPTSGVPPVKRVGLDVFRSKAPDWTYSADRSLGEFGGDFYRVEAFLPKDPIWCANGTASVVIEQDFERARQAGNQEDRRQRALNSNKRKEETLAANQAIATAVSGECDNVEQLRLYIRAQGKVVTPTCATKADNWQVTGFAMAADQDPCSESATAAIESAVGTMSGIVAAEELAARGDGENADAQSQEMIDSIADFNKKSLGVDVQDDLKGIPHHDVGALIKNGFYEETIAKVLSLREKYPDARFPTPWRVSAAQPNQDFAQDAALLTYLGQAYQRTGQSIKAMAAYRDALQREHDHGNSLVGEGRSAVLFPLGSLYERTGQYDLALTLYDGHLENLHDPHERLHDYARQLNTRIASIHHSRAILSPVGFPEAPSKAEQHYREAISLGYQRAYWAGGIQPPKDVVLALKNNNLPGTSFDTVSVGLPAIDLAKLYFELGWLEEAQAILEPVLQSVEKRFEANRLLTLEGDVLLATSIAGLGRDLEQTDEKLANLVPEIEELLGEDHPTEALALSARAEIAMSAGDPKQALVFSRDATRILLGRAERTRTASGLAARAELVRASRVFETHLAALRLVFEQEGNDFAHREDLMSESFEIAQWIQNSSAGAALSQLGARFGARNDGLGKMVRLRQDLMDRWQDFDADLVTARNQGAGPDEIATLTSELEKLETEIQAIDQRFASDFPEYQALASPKPLSVVDVREQLRDSEAFIFSFLGQRNVFVWSIGRDHVVWTKPDLSSAAIAEAVTKLRCDLDLNPANVHCDKQRRKLLKIARLGRMPFDRQTAHDLYRSVLEEAMSPVKDGDDVIIVPSGALTSLPLGVLVTEQPTGGDIDAAALKQTAWLADRHPLTVLPSVSSLQSLRVNASGQRASEPFAGFGDPVLRGHPDNVFEAEESGSDRNQTELQLLLPEDASAEAMKIDDDQTEAAVSSELDLLFTGEASSRVEVSDQRQADTTDTELDLLFRQGPEGPLADVNEIKKLKYLPKAKRELLDLASVIGVEESTVRHGYAATETAVKNSALLKTAGVVAFATHGIIAGEITTIAEPGLIFTPPDNETTSAEDDGLLTASEVAELDLAADWVLLSACNTANADGTPGAEALSGLARAFFYAGAKSIVVSHWNVEDQSAGLLTTKTAEILAGDAEISRAAALQKAMMDVKSGAEDQRFAHPMFWAPFMLIGESQRL